MPRCRCLSERSHFWTPIRRQLWWVNFKTLKINRKEIFLPFQRRRRPRPRVTHRFVGVEWSAGPPFVHTPVQERGAGQATALISPSLGFDIIFTIVIEIGGEVSNKVESGCGGESEIVVTVPSRKRERARKKCKQSVECNRRRCIQWLPISALTMASTSTRGAGCLGMAKIFTSSGRATCIIIHLCLGNFRQESINLPLHLYPAGTRRHV